MNRPSRMMFLVIFSVLIFSLGLTACSNSDGPTDPTDPVDPGDEPTDTTAPLLATTRPQPESPAILVDEVISAFFSEDMDPTSIPGNITLSFGTVTDLVLVGGREVEIHHDIWNEGDQVTVLFSTGLADTAGNHLAEAVSCRYWVHTQEVLILETTPAAGSIDVIRNAPVCIKFNQQMMVESLENGITASIADKADLGFTILETNETTYCLSFDEEIPSDTHVTIIVGTDCESAAHDFLIEEHVFSFDTGVDLDETAPELLGSTPATGTEISANTAVLQFTFSEPIDTEQLGFLRIDVLTLLAQNRCEIGASWNPEKTVLSVFFSGPLAPGIEMSIQLDDFHDLQGNVNSSHPTWIATVEGTADYFPVDEEQVFIFACNEEDGQGNSSFRYDFFHSEWTEGDRFRRKEYDAVAEAWNEWENLIRTSGATQLEGFRELHEGEPEDVVFSEPMQMLNHPTVTDSWSGNVQVVTAEETMNVVYGFEVLPGENDFPVVHAAKGGFFLSPTLLGAAKESDIELFWPNCRTVVEHFEGRVAGELKFIETDTLVYCPGFGLIKEAGHEIQQDEQEEYFTTSDLIGFDAYEDF